MSDTSSLSFVVADYRWILAAAGAIAVAVLVLLVWLLVRTPPTQSRRGATVGLAEQRALERDITTLMNDLSEMARQVGRQLDTRCARLEQLMREADQRIERLREMPPRATETAGKSTDPDDPDPRHVEIYRLCDEGLAAREIARRLERPDGEIELILALRPRKRDVVG